MNRERYLQDETNLRHQDKAGSLLPFSAGTTLIRNQRVFQIKAQLKMLRLIFLLLFSLFIMGCRDRSHLKYKAGDIVYLKPDSTRAVIAKLDNCGSSADYEIILGYKDGFFANNVDCITEDRIYGKETNP